MGGEIEAIVRLHSNLQAVLQSLLQDWHATAAGGFAARTALITYRLGHIVDGTEIPAPLRAPMRLLYRVLEIVSYKIVGKGLIERGARIGPRLVLVHGMDGVYINANAELGADVTVYHEVTIGLLSFDGTLKAAQIGDGVVLYAGAKVFGDVQIGDEAVVGANAVVLEDVPAGATVVGNPARVVKIDADGRTAKAERAQRTTRKDRR